MKHLKKLLSIVTLVGLTTSLVSCGNGTGTTGSSSKSNDITISFMASQDWVQDAELNLAKKFTEKTGIKVDYQVVPSDQYSNLLMTKLNSGEATDIFAVNYGRFDLETQINVEKNAVDLTNASWAKNVDKEVANELTVNGKLYGEPIQDVSSVWAVGYNKKIFKQLNLQIPKTYEEFKNVCEKIKVSGVTPIYESVSDGWHHTLWFPEEAVAAETATPGLYDKLNNNTATLEGNKTFETILSQVNEMAKLGYWGDNYMSNKYADAPKNIASGKYAMTLANQGFGAEVNKVDSSFSADDIGYFVAPLADNQSLNVNSEGPARLINSKSKYAKEAQEYLDFLASDESLAYLTENVSKFNKLPYSNAPNKYTDTIKEFYKAYPKSTTVLQTAVKYINPQWMEIGKDMSAMLVGEMQPNEILRNIDKNRAEQAKTAGDKAWK
ncbi:ABC transporter substrate-binding protein [Clostridium beijerinckii]|uniref:ABC transporter substrate-binding protein n=1 Tax=Clostridium beijerinckii TaxID=1520 RepID=UPI0003D2C56A|nr:ABC transporter substrate-binding protein [Clostridium beijerinckii]ALB45150.1 carbohydrate ABC transporter substrate-binding protein [Clostridium beijerinckii NRRL B-598]